MSKRRKSLRREIIIRISSVFVSLLLILFIALGFGFRQLAFGQVDTQILGLRQGILSNANIGSLPAQNFEFSNQSIDKFVFTLYSETGRKISSTYKIDSGRQAPSNFNLKELRSYSQSNFVNSPGVARNSVYRISVLKLPNGNYLQISYWIKPLLDSIRIATSALLVLGIISILLVFLIIRSYFRRIFESLEAIGEEATKNVISSRDVEPEFPTKYLEIGNLDSKYRSNLLRVQEEIKRRKAMEAELRNFNADLSHEIRTPLSVILANVGLIKLDQLSKSERDSALTLIESEISNIVQLVDLLLNLTSTSTETINLESIDSTLLYSRISDLVDGLDVQNRVRNDFPILSFSFLSNLELVLIIVRNFIDNALKYSEGEVSIRIQPLEDGYLEISVLSLGNEIPIEKREYIFQRLAKLDASRSSRGHGLGLPIAKQFAEILGGQVALRTHPGIGNEFVLRLPKA